MFLLYFCAVFIYNVQSSSTYTVSVYGDVYKDKDFFVRTFPWIIDNIGGDITVNFYMQGSGQYTVPQMCALDQLRDNTYLQAQFLKCEAKEQPSEICLCESGIDPRMFRDCVNRGGSLAGESASMFLEMGIDITPLIELGPRSTVFGVEDTWYLKKICTIFGDSLPRGCVRPFACNGTEVLKSRKSISQFDRCCSDVECRRSDATSTTTAAPTSTAIWYNTEQSSFT